jgi:transcriptional regulator with XRE-family HTH domain
MEVAILPVGEYQKACGQRLRKLLKILSISNTKAAEVMGVSKQVLNHWLKGNNPIQVHNLYRLSRATGVDFNYVFLGDWAGLPYRVAAVLDEELKATLEAVAERDRPGLGSRSRKRQSASS